MSVILTTGFMVFLTFAVKIQGATQVMIPNREERTGARPGASGRYPDVLAAFFALLWVLMVLAPVQALAGGAVQGRDNVLVLHSYSQDFVWTRSQQDGVDAVFGPLSAAYDVRMEYLDALRQPGLLKKPILLDLLRTKFADQQFRVVLTSDNAAFDFARAHRNELFPGVPIVFMGLNGYQDSLLASETGITGVAEDGDLFGTLQVLLQLAPQTRRIIFPGMLDDLTYRAIRSTAAKELAALPPQVAVEFPEFSDVDAALDALKTLPSDSAIVIMSNMRTRAGQGISSQRVVEFTNWDCVVGHGALGGSVISGMEQGRQAAEIALRVLRGEPAQAIPVRRGAGKTLLFDYQQLARFGIPASRLPKGAVVLFAPERSLRISHEAAWVSGVSFVLLLGVAASLFLAVRRRRRAEEQVRTLNQELEQRVQERTAQLEASNKELEEFSYSMSHDMRSPLRALDGYSTILLEKYGAGFDDECKRLLRVLQTSARQQGRLVDDILRFLALGRQKMHPSMIDLTQMASDVFAEFQAAEPARQMHLDIGVLPPTRGDVSMIRLAMQNLLSNAIKHSSTDHQTLIEIAGVAGEQEHTYSITDHGAGFDMRYADKLFRVFERVHPAGEYEGSGVGLAIVKRIIERHGGRVWAEGRVGEGATFYFTLPHAKLGDAREGLHNSRPEFKAI
ncbi:MAG: multi-sensor signal transduction histidine kinase [Comamonadaceae bacterium]|nr:MAG: multi-sensor signal transduction histidine kinase [Comamonadaceae bacterium]